MQQLQFIDKPMTQHVSGTIVPIFRSAILYTTAYGFRHLKVLAWVLGRRVAGRVHSLDAIFRKTASTQCTRPASRRPKTHANTLNAENHMQ